MNTEYLTIKQVATMLKLSRRTIDRYIESGRIRAFKVGKGKRAAVRIKASELDRLELIGYEANMEQLRKEIMEE